jgi:archaellum component FlaF (FlaF/FlaG flagellin family)
MGFGVVGATALLAVTVVTSTYTVTAAWFDAESQLREARMVSDTLEAEAARSTFTVALDHQAGAGHVTLTLRNTGSVTLDGAGLDVLLDGVQYRGADITVTGHGGTLWHPGETLTLFLHGTDDLGDVFTATSPARAAVSAANGAMGFWSP